MVYSRRNYLKRVKDVQEITQKYYEVGRRDRCYKWIWRNYIYPKYHYCYYTYLRMIGINVRREMIKEYSNHYGKSLFPDFEN